MREKDAVAKSPPPPKEPYKPPRLTKQGNIQELTQGGAGSLTDGPQTAKGGMG